MFRIFFVFQIAEEYWRCHVNLLSANRIATAVESRKITIDKDREACDTLNMDLAMVRSNQMGLFLIQHDDCCRSLLTTVDWNMACASGTKYRWEGEEEPHKRRNHWTEEVLPSNTQCSSFRVLPASLSLCYLRNFLIFRSADPKLLRCL